MQAGARAVPIKINEPDEYYEDMFRSINGLLLPGGGVSVETSGYAKIAKTMFNMAKEANDAGDVFPIWGTCLGFEQLAVLVDENCMSDVEGWNQALPLNFTNNYADTTMYSSLTPAVHDYITTHGATQNMHHQGLLTKTYEASRRLKNFYTVLTTNTDDNGLEYVSSMEGKNYPFYAVQYHPEKNIFDWDTSIAVDHSGPAISFTQSLAGVFVEQARQSNHRFPNVTEESSALIENYSAVYLGEPSFYRLYFFNFK